MLRWASLVLSISCLGIISCTNKSIKLSEKEKIWLKDNSNLKVSVLLGSYPPYQFENKQNEVMGIYIDYWNLIEEKIGYEFIKVKYKNQSTLINDALEDKSHVVLAVEKTKKRAEHFSFFTKLFVSDYVLVTRIEEADKINLDNFHTKDLIVVPNQGITEIIKRDFPEADLFEVNSSVEALRILSKGGYQVFFGPRSAVNYFINNNSFNNLVISGTNFKFEPSILVTNTEPILKGIIKKAVSSISAIEESQILDNWLLTKRKPLYLKLSFLIPVIGSLITIIGVGFLFNKRLNTIILRRTEELEIALKNSRLSNKLKNQFIRNISHEIRTPMNGVLGYSELLSKQEISKEEQKEYALTIIDSGKELVSVIENILEISSLQTGDNSCDLKETNITEVFENIISVYRNCALKKGIKLIFKKLNAFETDIILVDKEKLEKIIKSILDNAIKFTEKGKVELDYSINADILNITINDTGVGIQEEKKGIIFEAFSFSEKVTVEKLNGGLGLGLTIAKKNATIIKGDITFESKEGKGSTFFINLPIKKIKKGFNVKRIKTVKPKNKTYKILIAEDEEINFMLVNSILLKSKIFNFEIIRAMNGREAVSICKNNKDISLILMDIRMPIMNGYQATKIIKKMQPNIPIIAHTAYSTDKDLKEAYAVGCSNVITKPVNLDEFNKVIEDSISKMS